MFCGTNTDYKDDTTVTGVDNTGFSTPYGIFLEHYQQL